MITSFPINFTINKIGSSYTIRPFFYKIFCF